MTNNNQNDIVKGILIGSNQKLKQRFVKDLVSACLFKHLYPMLMAAQERYQMPILPEEVGGGSSAIIGLEGKLLNWPSDSGTSDTAIERAVASCISFGI